MLFDKENVGTVLPDKKQIVILLVYFRKVQKQKGR
jgi:hypothetical protein